MIRRDAEPRYKESEELDLSSSHTSLRQLSSSLNAPGKASLESLASLSITLDAPSPSADALACTIITATQTSQSLSQHLTHLQNLQRRLETELLSLRQQLQEIRSQDFQPAMSLTRQTLEWTRNTKQLRNKLSEYSDRLAGLQNGSATVAGEEGSDIVEVVEHERKLEELRKEVDVLEGSVKAFQGLPKSKDGARREVDRVNKELDALKRKRDGLFEDLVEKG
jgi:HAUS augmin-like complex subunit 1